MATPVVMPSFGMYTAEGTVANWLQQDGARVEMGDPILEIETDKALNEVIAPNGGILRHVAKPGMTIKEQGLLGYILAEGESMPEADAGPLPTADTSSGTQPKDASADKVGKLARASPLARSIAKEHGVELSTIKGSGPGGRIVEADVKARVEQEKPVVANPVIPTVASRSVGGKQVGLNSMRKSIGERLRRSLDTAVHLTLTREVEADQLVAARETISEKLGTSIPFDAFFMKFLSLALRERPELNVVADGDALIQIDDVNIGFAVALPQGLVVPVINKVDTISMVRIASEILRLSEHARSNRLRSDEVSGGTSTVTNLGAYAVDAFTPILNPPQSSILGVGRILPRPVVKSGLMTIANTCWLSFTFDHRVTDGVPAAQTLGAIARMMNDADFLSTLT